MARQPAAPRARRPYGRGRAALLAGVLGALLAVGGCGAGDASDSS
ncbi:hypothetical protein CIB93_09460, partial [Streptomyces sp. WZ.A104]